VVDGGLRGISFLANRGRWFGRNRDQTVSDSAAAWKARETAVARKASPGEVSAITCSRRSSGRRSISQAAGISMMYFGGFYSENLWRGFVDDSSRSTL
jgi:hypothetical protein